MQESKRRGLGVCILIVLFYFIDFSNINKSILVSNFIRDPFSTSTCRFNHIKIIFILFESKEYQFKRSSSRQPSTCVNHAPYLI